MTTVIEIAPITARQSGGLGHLRLFHQECQGVPLIAHRNVVTDRYTLQCVCGLTLQLPTIGPAAETFHQTAIDQQARSVPKGAYTSSVDGDLQVTTKSVA